MLFRNRWTMQVWMIVCGNTAVMASGKPFSPMIRKNFLEILGISSIEMFRVQLI